MSPVTVSITRHIDPEHTAEMLAWVEAGASLAERFDGFLGVGWVRPSAESEEWHMLYRFADVDALAVWEASAQRTWWLAAAQGRIGESRVERRTGIEGWFDVPTATIEMAAIRTLTEPARPPRWKQAVSIWLGFFPVNLAFTLLAVAFLPGWDDWWTLAKVLATTLVLTPIMAYWVLPFVTRMLQPWLTAPARAPRR